MAARKKKGRRAKVFKTVDETVLSGRRLGQVVEFLERDPAGPRLEPDLWAFVATISEEDPHGGIGVAIANQAGYYRYPNWLFPIPPLASYDEAREYAQQLNQLRGMGSERASAIKASSMFPGARANRGRRNQHRYRKLSDAAKRTGDSRYAGKGTKIWYKTFTGEPKYSNPSFERWAGLGMGSDWFREQGVQLPTKKTLSETHRLLGEISGRPVTAYGAGVDQDLETVYHLMQGEVWSPQGEARDLIQKAGLRHTSMSMGDIIEQNGKLYLVDTIGFFELGGRRNRRDRGTFDQAAQAWADTVNEWYDLGATKAEMKLAYAAYEKDKTADYLRAFFRAKQSGYPGTWSMHLDTEDREGLADAIERMREGETGPFPAAPGLTKELARRALLSPEQAAQARALLLRKGNSKGNGSWNKFPKREIGWEESPVTRGEMTLEELASGFRKERKKRKKGIPLEEWISQREGRGMKNCPYTAKKRRRALFNILTLGMADRVIPSRNPQGEFLPFSVAAPALDDYRKTRSYRPALSRDLRGRFVSEDIEAAGLVRGGSNRAIPSRNPEGEFLPYSEAAPALEDYRKTRSYRPALSRDLQGRFVSEDVEAAGLVRGGRNLSFREWCELEARESEKQEGMVWDKKRHKWVKPRGQRKDVGGFEIRKGKWKGEEVGRGRARHRYSGNPLTTQRRRMPASDFALPVSAQSAKFKRDHPKNAGAYPMFDRAHAANARSRATQMLNAGWLTLREAQTIYNRTSDRWDFAYKRLEQNRQGKWRSVKVASKPPLRAAANRYSPYNPNW